MVRHRTNRATFAISHIKKRKQFQKKTHINHLDKKGTITSARRDSVRINFLLKVQKEIRNGIDSEMAVEKIGIAEGIRRQDRTQWIARALSSSP